MIELKFQMLAIQEGGKSENPEKNPGGKAGTNNKLNPGHNQTWVTFAEGERSHPWGKSASLAM